jgi:hypothetical protein
MGDQYASHLMESVRNVPREQGKSQAGGHISDTVLYFYLFLSVLQLQLFLRALINIILKQRLRKRSGRLWTGLVWLRTESSG